MKPVVQAWYEKTDVTSKALVSSRAVGVELGLAELALVLYTTGPGLHGAQGRLPLPAARDIRLHAVTCATTSTAP